MRRQALGSSRDDVGQQRVVGGGRRRRRFHGLFGAVRQPVGHLLLLRGLQHLLRGLDRGGFAGRRLQQIPKHFSRSDDKMP